MTKTTINTGDPYMYSTPGGYTTIATNNLTNGTLTVNAGGTGWSIADTTDYNYSSDITITDNEGNPKTLSTAEVGRLYNDAMEYRRILRFSRIFGEVKGMYRELLTLIQLMDPMDEDELIALEEEIKDDN